MYYPVADSGVTRETYLGHLIPLAFRSILTRVSFRTARVKYHLGMTQF